MEDTTHYTFYKLHKTFKNIIFQKNKKKLQKWPKKILIP